MAVREQGSVRRGRQDGFWRFARRTLWQAYYQFEKDNGWVIAGHIAFMGLFAIFPFLILLLAVAGLLGQGEAATASIDLALSILPPDVAGGIRPAIQEVRNAPHVELITTSFLVVIWASSSGLEALRHALNLAYDVSNRPAFWRTRLESIVLTVVAAIVTIVAMVLLVVVPISLDVAAWFLEQPLQQVSFYNSARYLLGIGLLLGLLMTLYKLLPNVQLRPLEIVPGAVFAWALWVGAQWLYTLYLRSVPSYSVTYGSLGGIIVTLFFFYISALLFILGAEVNSVLRRRRVNREARR